MSFYRALFFHFLFLTSTFAFNVIAEITLIISRIFKTILWKGDLECPKEIKMIKKFYSHLQILILRLVNIKIYLRGKMTPDAKIWISNHRSELDGYILKTVLESYGDNLAIVAKKKVQHVPIFGNYGWRTGYIYIERSRQKDIETLEISANYNFNRNNSVLIFPEGTTFSSESKMRSDHFAMSNNLTKTNHVLVPKKTGFEIIRNAGYQTVGDITIRYDKPKLNPVLHHSVISSLYQYLPSEIYLDINTLDVNAIDLDLYQVFQQKDQLLSRAIEYPNYQPIKMPIFGTILSVLIYLLFFYYFIVNPKVAFFSTAITVWTAIKMYLI